jgi:hypothetical protein
MRSTLAALVACALVAQAHVATAAETASPLVDRPAPLASLVAPRVEPLSTDDDLFFAGFFLVGAGLLAGGAGFTILGICSQDDEDCSDTLVGVGWALAAPGIPPVVIGLGFLLLSDRTSASLPPSYRDPWYRAATIALQPTPGGGVASLGLSF